ncbi:MAG: thioredoxin family protein [Lachnospiraceae bacterium]|jgi:glutaredoxin
MKEILMFYLQDCGYCAKAFRAMDELKKENPSYSRIPFRKIEESRQPDIADQYDYTATPTFYVDGKKVFEAHIGMSYDEIKEEVRRVFETAAEH